MNLNRNKITMLLILLVAFMGISCGGGETKKAAPKATGDSLVDQLTIELEKTPEDIDLLYQRASILYEKEEFEASIADLEKAIKVDSLKPEIYHLLADNYLDYFRSREALDMMQKVVRLFPERIPSLLKFSEIQMILNQNENSIYTVNEILRLSPQNNEAYFMLGMNFRAMGELDRSINSFQTAVENDPEMVDAWLILGELHEKKGSKNVVRFYDNAINVAPDKPEVLHSKAFYLQNHGDIPGALELYKEINIKTPNYGEAYLNAGLIRMDQDSLDLAFEQMNILAGIEPQNPLAYYYRGLIHNAYGNYEAAVVDLQNSINLSSDFTVAEELLAEIRAKMPKQPEGE